MFDLFGLKDFYQRLLMKRLSYFLLAVFVLACAPIFGSFIFDYIAASDHSRFHPYFLLGIVLFMLALMVSFLSIILWSSVRSYVAGTKKLTIILFTYLMIWFSFGNLYYFISNTENYVQVMNKIQPGSMELFDRGKMLRFQRHAIINNIPPLWDVEVQGGRSRVTPINRTDGYFDCLYFSGVTLLTIGYSDIVPVSQFAKMMVLLEAFLGQFINIIAIGLWLSSMRR